MSKSLRPLRQIDITPFTILDSNVLFQGPSSVLLKRFPDVAPGFTITKDIEQSVKDACNFKFCESYFKLGTEYANNALVCKAFGDRFSEMTPLTTEVKTSIQFCESMSDDIEHLFFLSLQKFDITGTTWFYKGFKRHALNPSPVTRLIQLIFVFLTFLDTLHAKGMLHMDAQVQNTLFSKEMGSASRFRGVVSEFGALQGMDDIRNECRILRIDRDTAVRHTKFVGTALSGPLLAHRPGFFSERGTATQRARSQIQTIREDWTTFELSYLTSAGQLDAVASYDAWVEYAKERSLTYDPLPDAMMPYLDFHVLAWSLMSVSKLMETNTDLSRAITDVVKLLVGSPGQIRTARSMFQAIEIKLNRTLRDPWKSTLYKSHAWMAEEISQPLTQDDVDDAEVARSLKEGGERRLRLEAEALSLRTAQIAAEEQRRLENLRVAEAAAQKLRAAQVLRKTTQETYEREETLRQEALKRQQTQAAKAILNAQLAKAAEEALRKAQQADALKQQEALAQAQRVAHQQEQARMRMRNPSKTCLELNDAVFREMTAQVNSRAGMFPFFSVTYADHLFKISGARSEIAISIQDLTCDLDNIPEILAIYIIAQMLKIAQADTLDGCDRSISDAQVHIAAKLRMLEAVHGKLTRQQPQLGGEKDTNTTLMLAARDLRQKMLLSEAQQHEVRVYHIMDSTEFRLNHVRDVPNRLRYIKFNAIDTLGFAKNFEAITLHCGAVSEKTNKPRALILCRSNIHKPELDIPAIVRTNLGPSEQQDSKLSLHDTTIYHVTDGPGRLIPRTGDGVEVLTQIKKVVNMLEFPCRSLDIDAPPWSFTNASFPKKSNVFNYQQVTPAELDTIPLRFVLDEVWWYKRFTRTPLCANGRLVQQRGTCWWNAGANIMLLSEPIASLLRIEWKKQSGANKNRIGQLTLEHCPTSTITHKDFLLVLINQILIKRQKARPWQQDFSSTGAGLAKNSAKGDQQYSNKVTNKAYNATLYGSLFYTAYGLTATFMQILGLGVNYNVIYPSSQDLLAVEATNTLSWDTSRWSQFTELPILPQDDAGKAAAARQDKELRSLNAWKYYPYPMIVTLHIADANVCPLEITINGLPYDLDAAGISVDITLVTGHPDDKVMHHAIAGLTCKSGRGTTRYIYDSNNYLAEDDWTQLRWSRDKPLVTGMENYAAKVAGNGKQYYERCDFQRFDVLVYVLRKID